MLFWMTIIAMVLGLILFEILFEHDFEISCNISGVIFNPPATIVLWEDGTKTVVKCQEDETYSKEIGLAMCICKKVYGNKGNYNNIFKKFIKEY